MKKLFKNPVDGRLRSGWRILLFLVIFYFIAMLIFPLRQLTGATRRDYLEDYSFVIICVLALAATVAAYLARRFLDKNTFSSLGLRINKRAGLDLMFGFLLSGLMAGTFFLLLYVTGLIEFNGFNYGIDTGAASGKSSFVQFMSVVSVGSLAILFIEHVIVGYWEELAFRGYLLQNMIEGLGVAAAVIVSCLLYGLVHAANPNAGLLSTAIIVLFGFLRIFGYLTTKMLWLSMGMHIGWNFFQSPIFGFAASGHSKSTLFNIAPNGPGYLTGGDFGPEGSLLIIPILICALAVMRWWANKQYGQTDLTIEALSSNLKVSAVEG